MTLPALPTPASVLDLFLAGRNDRTRRAYRQALEDFRVFAGEPTAREAAGRLLAAGAGGANALALAYRAHLLERGLSPATINHRLAALRSLTKLARVVGAVAWSIETPNVPSAAYRDTRGPGRDAFRRMLARASMPGDARARRDTAILRLLYDLGLRRSEVVALDRDDVDLERRTVAVQAKRRREKEPLSLPAPTLAALRGWLAERGNEAGPLFVSYDRARKGDGRLSDVSVYRLVRRLGAETGVRATPHGLRHTAITEACKAAAAAGIGLDEVLDFSRHRDVSVLMIYRDRERNVQGDLSARIAAAAPADHRE